MSEAISTWLAETGFLPAVAGGGGLSAAAVTLPSALYAANFDMGTAVAQLMLATTAKPDLVGLGGNDTLNGSADDNFLVGDYFDLTLLDAWNGVGPYPAYDASTSGRDLLVGGDGRDLLVSDQGNDTLDGGNGNDIFVVWASAFGVDQFLGGAGADALYFEDDWNLGITTFTTSRLILGAAASVESVFLEGFTLTGTDGNDVFNLSGVSNLVYSSPGITPRTILLLGGDDSYVGSSSQDSVDGGLGNDTLLGGNGNDLLIGNTGNDNLFGGPGADELRGGAGMDSLTGGPGADRFVFGTPPGVANVDTVADFTSGSDMFVLQNTGAGLYGALPDGALASAAFKIIGTGGTAVDATDRILYDQAAGNLYYDPDGSGALAPVLFAHVTPGVTITFADFLVI